MFYCEKLTLYYDEWSNYCRYYFMNFFSKFSIIIILIFNISQCFAQSSNSNVTIISSPDSVISASARNGTDAIQVLNSSGLSFASTFNIGLASLALGLVVAYVWDGSDSEQSSSSSSSTN